MNNQKINTFPILLAAVALGAAEVFAYCMTDPALARFLGEASISGVRWSVILTFLLSAFDFSGLVYLTYPKQGVDDPSMVRWVFAAWLFTGIVRAALVWWSIQNSLIAKGFLLSPQTLLGLSIFITLATGAIRVFLTAAILRTLYWNFHPLPAPYRIRQI